MDPMMKSMKTERLLLMEAIRRMMFSWRSKPRYKNKFLEEALEEILVADGQINEALGHNLEVSRYASEKGFRYIHIEIIEHVQDLCPESVGELPREKHLQKRPDKTGVLEALDDVGEPEKAVLILRPVQLSQEGPNSAVAETHHVASDLLEPLGGNIILHDQPNEIFQLCFLGKPVNLPAHQRRPPSLLPGILITERDTSF